MAFMASTSSASSVLAISSVEDILLRGIEPFIRVDCVMCERGGSRRVVIVGDLILPALHKIGQCVHNPDD
jgi:hypothetical protein